jgi:hypothetical protein
MIYLILLPVEGNRSPLMLVVRVLLREKYLKPGPQLKMWGVPEQERMVTCWAQKFEG